MSRNILVMRHADVYDNPGGKRVLYGNLPGYWLTQLGIRQARAAGDFLRDLCKLDIVVSSPLERTRQTSEIVIVRNNGNPELLLEEELRDIGVTPWEGEVLREDWTANRERHWQQQLDQSIEDLEHPKAMQERALRAFRKHVDQHQDANILFVSHGDIICFLLQHFANEPQEPLVNYHRGVNKASVFGIDSGPPAVITKLYEPTEYGTVYPRGR